ncbi:6-O-methylguanine DNA methyltransferase, DNA binding domain protein [Candidatus Erwinia dacicola]|uniref:6-O-methylguanine DNA methyltransferase, DNA binding domain protein n=1 Tax=Candidatus Erwinia dacicola TaxID=252393 RepID=A0A328TKJ8_9GAMM|nr:6-O-methylguanine DNA methyltransferase, DNA binding domain protein [Candidatus Erwinia dacicola]
MARLVGSSRAARQVGGVLKRLPKGSKLPWYRVINRKGKISLTGDDLSRQRKALQAEEIKVGAGMVPDGVTRVGEVEGTVVGAPLFVGISISGTAPASRQVVTLVPVVTTCFTVLVINISLPSTLTAAFSRMRAFGWIPARLNGRVNWNGACLPSVRPTRCTAL